MNEMYFDWGAPMDAGRNDPVIGVSEWGTPVYRSSLGHTYWREKPRPKPERKMGLWEMLPAYTGELETTRKAPDGVSQPGVKDAAALAGGWLLGGLDVPRRALAGEPVRRGDVMATALDAGMMAAPMPAPKGALRAGGMADDAPKGIKAYHGSPHDFARFSMDKIGTGEGAQAYGHGLYFADSEDVARSYRDALRFPRVDGAANVFDRVKDDLNYHRGNVDGVRSIYQGMVERGDEAAAKLGAEKLAVLDQVVNDNPGHMYEVNINANPDDFLDWDAPLSEQIGISSRLNAQKSAAQSKIKELEAQRKNLLSQQPVQAETGDEFADLFSGSDWEGWKRVSEIDAQIRELEQNARHAEKLAGVGFEKTRRSDDWIIPTTGADLVEGMGRPENVAATLRDAGIPGIKYYDGASRGAGQGTRNYVVFDENLISILRKYGIGAMVPGAGYMLNDAEYSSVERMQ